MTEATDQIASKSYDISEIARAFSVSDADLAPAETRHFEVSELPSLALPPARQLEQP